MPLTSMATKRIGRDILQVTSVDAEGLASQGIYYIPCEANIQLGTAMLIGREGTPYYGGFYFFSIEFPDDYPFSPVRARSLTQDGHTRFNPNMYLDGKVCLSILNTWHDGPQWSGVQTLTSVLLAIMSDVLTAKPLQNEPAYRDYGDSAESLTYNRLLWHANLQTAILQQLCVIPHYATPFLAIMKPEFIKRLPTLLKLCGDASVHDGTSETCRVFRMTHKYNFVLLSQRLSELGAVE